MPQPYTSTPLGKCSTCYEVELGGCLDSLSFPDLTFDSTDGNVTVVNPVGNETVFYSTLSPLEFIMANVGVPTGWVYPGTVLTIHVHNTSSGQIIPFQTSHTGDTFFDCIIVTFKKIFTA